MENPIENNPLLMLLGSVTPLPGPFQQRVIEQTLTEDLQPKQHLLEPGETCRRIYYIESGLLRTYYLDEQGHQHTTWLLAAGELIISVHSFFSQQPAQEYLQALRPSKLRSLSWHQLQSYYADFPQGNLIGRILTEKYYIRSEERTLSMRTLSPRKRFELLLEKQPDIEQLTTTSILASYLGISRENFSRMRSCMLRKNTQQTPNPKNNSKP